MYILICDKLNYRAKGKKAKSNGRTFHLHDLNFEA